MDRECKMPVTILMADDDADDRFLSQFAFKRLEVDHTLEFVSDGEQMMNYLNSKLNSNEALPDVILLDLNMPKKNGKETLKEIKSHDVLKKLKVIIFSTSKLHEDMNVTKELGAESYIVKPNNLQNLMAVYRKICDQFGESNSLDKPQELYQ